MFTKLQVPILLVAIIALGVWYYTDTRDVTVKELFFPARSVVKVGDVPIRVGVATTSEQRAHGLSGRESLEPLEGLLFVFDEVDYHGIWMKDMRFPIDVIWISEDMRVVGITEGLLPESYPEVFEPPEPVKYVLETARYYSESFDIEVGDTVEIPEELLR